jgi:SAM-dependent methyltransferase
METESSLMRLFSWLGRERFSWSLRRLHCPVDRSALVLEVGSGGNPYYRANILLDAYEDTRERHWAPLITDRPTVLGFVENLPFKDKAFDYVIASHVLEHSTDPKRFLAELQRVANAGYIEVPDAFMERINPYLDHRLEITVRNGCLVIRKKKAWQVDPNLVELYEKSVKGVIVGETIPRYPFAFHVRYYWQKKIDFVVVNPEEDASWKAPVSDEKEMQKGRRAKIHQIFLTFARAVLSQHFRNRRIDLQSLLTCPRCGAGGLNWGREEIECIQCSAIYQVRDGIPVMYYEVRK